MDDSKDDTKELIELIDAFLIRHGKAGKPMADATFGRQLLGNSGFLSQLRGDKISPKLKTVTKIKMLMKNLDKKKEMGNGASA